MGSCTVVIVIPFFSSIILWLLLPCPCLLRGGAGGHGGRRAAGRVQPPPHCLRPQWVGGAAARGTNLSLILTIQIALDINRISSRNLGRDDRLRRTPCAYIVLLVSLLLTRRCIASHGKESRIPFLDENVVHILNGMPVEEKVLTWNFYCAVRSWVCVGLFLFEF